MSAADVFEGLCPARPEVGMPAYVFYILIAIASLIGTLITIVGTQKFWECKLINSFPLPHSLCPPLLMLFLRPQEREGMPGFY